MTLPLHPHPAEGGLLSDHLIRLSIVNGVTPCRLVRWLGLPYLLEGDLDRFISRQELTQLAAGTGLPEEALTAATLQPFINNLHGSQPPGRVARFVVVIDRNFLEPGRRGHPLCPHCLAEGRPVQRIWRLTTTVMCERHYTGLVDRCPSCGNTINPLRPYINLKAGRMVPPQRPHLCSTCNKDLRSKGVDMAVPLLQTLMTEAVVSGSISWDSEVFHVQDFQQIVYPLLHLHAPVGDRSGKRRMPEGVPLQMRRGMVEAASHILEGGQQEYFCHLRKYGFAPATLMAGVREDRLPDGFRTAIHSILPRQRPSTSLRQPNAGPSGMDDVLKRGAGTMGTSTCNANKGYQ